MPKENTTEYIILGLLSHENLSGYDIKNRIDKQISYFWNAGYGQIYPTLQSLEKGEYIKPSEGAASKGPEKHIYSITETGRERLKEWLAVPGEKEYTKYEILLKLFFGSQLPVADNQKRIEAFKDRHTQNLQLMKLFKTNLEAVMNETEDHFYFYLTVLFGEHIHQAYLDWAEEAERMISDRKNQML